MKPVFAGILTAAVLAVLAGGRAGAQSPDIDELIPRATAYTHDFVERFSNVVAEERYEQETTSPRRKRLLVSDFLLVKYPGDALWQTFRDVAEVDGMPVRDREERMITLFLQPSSNALRRASEIASAGSQYSLVDVGTLSNPLAVLGFLQRHYVGRFRFNPAGLEKKLGPDVRTVRFVEFTRPTILRTDASRDLPSEGLIWIEEGTGRVVKTELQLGGQTAPLRIATLFTFDEDLGINVPAVMEDRYPRRGGEFKGKATYGKFRRFQIKTQETIQP